MKRAVRPKTREQVEGQFPLADQVPGWFFRVREVSAGCYRVDGTDLLGHQVSRRSQNPDDALKQCKLAASAILGEVRSDH